MRDILKFGGFKLEKDLRLTIARLEVVVERMEQKFDTFSIHCTTSLFVMEKRLGEIGHIVSQFVDKSGTVKDAPHDMGGNNEVELDDPKASEEC
ncbi:unnamed protein product [Ilex paraguariensis]|uniref:Uncharacterized protein n=1 Tax=Ilex paraguariensis TaxID=185542 RepID=A0ABC8REK3_9AQUA